MARLQESFAQAGIASPIPVVIPIPTLAPIDIQIENPPEIPMDTVSVAHIDTPEEAQEKVIVRL